MNYFETLCYIWDHYILKLLIDYLCIYTHIHIDTYILIYICICILNLAQETWSYIKSPSSPMWFPHWLEALIKLIETRKTTRVRELLLCLWNLLRQYCWTWAIKFQNCLFNTCYIPNIVLAREYRDE